MSVSTTGWGRQVKARQLDDRLVLEMTRGGDHDVGLGVAVVVIARDLGNRDRADHVGVSQHAATERVLAVHGGGQHVVHAVLWLVLVHRDLLEHHPALGVDLVDGQRRIDQHLGQESKRLVGVLVEEPRVQVRRFLAGRGVRGGPHAVEELGDLDRRMALRALEQQVLEEVRHARLGGRLVTRARAHPHAERDRAHGGHLLRDDPNAVGGLRQADALGQIPRGADIGGCRAQWRRLPLRPRSRPPSRRSPRPPPPPRPPPRGPRSPEPTFASSAGDLPSTAGSSERRRPMRPRSRSTSTTVTSSSSPCLRTSSTESTRSPGLTLEMWSSPSVPLVSSTKAPNAVVLTTLPLNLSPTSASLVIASMRAIAASTRAPLGAYT